MKHTLHFILSILLVVCVAFGAFGCDKTTTPTEQAAPTLTYVDDNGQQVEVQLRATDNTDDVTEVLVAIAKQQATQYSSIQATASVDFGANVYSATDATHMSLAANIEGGLNVPKITPTTKVSTYLNDMAPYLKVSARGNFAIDMLDEQNLDVMHPKAMDEAAELYYADSTVYGKVKLSQNVKDKLADTDIPVAELSDKYLKLDLSALLVLADTYLNFDDIRKKLPSFDSANPVDKVLDILNLIGEQPADDSRSALSQLVQKLHLTISSVDGSVLTFRASLSLDTGIAMIQDVVKLIAPNQQLDQDTLQYYATMGQYDGSSYFTFGIDAKTMRLTSVQLDARAIMDCLTKALFGYDYTTDDDGNVTATQRDAANTITFNVNSANLGLSLSYDATVPTVDAAKVADALDLTSALAGLLAGLGLGAE